MHTDGAHMICGPLFISVRQGFKGIKKAVTHCLKISATFTYRLQVYMILSLLMAPDSSTNLLSAQKGSS